MVEQSSNKLNREQDHPPSPPAGERAQPPDHVAELTRIMARLRSAEGCPWDREQTHSSLKEFLAEEAAELFDAIDNNDHENMIEELGDVLLQVVFHCQIAAEQKRFELADVAKGICEKLIRRHPHVFADRQIDNPEEVLRQWERIKLTEKKKPGNSSLDGVPRNLSALHRAHKIQGKAARVGFDWPAIDQVIEKIEEELRELKEAIAGGNDQAIDEEIGDLLFSAVNLCRYRRRLADDLLHATIEKFYKRFNQVENELRLQGKKPEACSLTELENLWQKAKHDS